jgi:hypothetical protein
MQFPESKVGESRSGDTIEVLAVDVVGVSDIRDGVI